MQYLHDARKLCDILIAEMNGEKIDLSEAHVLARRLTVSCPEIAFTLERIAHRVETVDSSTAHADLKRAAV
jgi:hypothetical protein